jgi:hypothetical protein
MATNTRRQLALTGSLLAGALGFAGCTHTADDRAAPDEGAMPGMQHEAKTPDDQAAMGHDAVPRPTTNGLTGSADGLRIVAADRRLTTRRRARFAFRIVDHSGQPVRRFGADQTKRMHLIVVRRDLTGYQHLHPTMAPDGTWSSPLRLERPGPHRAFADFVVAGKRLVLGIDITATGDYRPIALKPPSAEAGADGYRVALAGAGRVRSGVQADIRFTVRRAEQPVRDLQPYLGALGHLVVIRASDLAYLHVHPHDSNAGSGPTVRFIAELPRAGLYGAFLQFQTAGTVRTASVTLLAQPGSRAPSSGENRGHDGH